MCRDGEPAANKGTVKHSSYGSLHLITRCFRAHTVRRMGTNAVERRHVEGEHEAFDTSKHCFRIVMVLAFVIRLMKIGLLTQCTGYHCPRPLTTPFCRRQALRLPVTTARRLQLA